ARRRGSTPARAIDEHRDHAAGRGRALVGGRGRGQELAGRGRRDDRGGRGQGRGRLRNSEAALELAAVGIRCRDAVRAGGQVAGGGREAHAGAPGVAVGRGAAAHAEGGRAVIAAAGGDVGAGGQASGGGGGAHAGAPGVARGYSGESLRAAVAGAQAIGGVGPHSVGGGRREARHERRKGAWPVPDHNLRVAGSGCGVGGAVHHAALGYAVVALARHGAAERGAGAAHAAGRGRGYHGQGRDGEHRRGQPARSGRAVGRGNGDGAGT
nr:hypothetical protein [Tanacetum cinerariifolium]